MTPLITSLVMLLIEAIVSEIAKDAYISIKKTILRKYPSVDFEKIEENPTSIILQETLSKQLEETGANKDEEILTLTASLIDIVQTSKEKNSKDSEFPKTSTSLIEFAELEAGRVALRKLFEKHFSDLIRIRDISPIDDIDLISTKVANHQKLSNNYVSQEIGFLHQRIRGIIQRVAFFVESRKTLVAEQIFNDANLTFVNREKARKIVNADNRVKISYQTLKATIEYFKDMNETILEWANDPLWKKREMGLAFWNALLAYELTDYVISYIENFTVDGYKELENLYEETRRTNELIRQEEKELEIQARNLDEADELARVETLEEIKLRNEAMVILEKEWVDYLESVKSVDGEFNAIKSKLPVLKVRRQSALNQIKVLQVVEMLRIIKQNISMFEGAITTLESIKLMPLSPERIKRLLGVTK